MAQLYEDHADLYDLAFDWEVSEEVAWLGARLGSACRSVLEPDCGSGRMVEALAQGHGRVQIEGAMRSDPAESDRSPPARRPRRAHRAHDLARADRARGRGAGGRSPRGAARVGVPDPQRPLPPGDVAGHGRGTAGGAAHPRAGLRQHCALSLVRGRGSHAGPCRRRGGPRLRGGLRRYRRGRRGLARAAGADLGCCTRARASRTTRPCCSTWPPTASSTADSGSRRPMRWRSPRSCSAPGPSPMPAAIRTAAGQPP